MPKTDHLLQYKNKVRVRVCGILEKDNEILMIKHKGLLNNDVWLPPGGGIEFGETTEDALVREFREETNLKVTINEFIGINEYITNELHAIELFYKVIYKSGTLRLGYDPEMDKSNQLLKEIKFLRKNQAQKHIPIDIQKI